MKFEDAFNKVFDIENEQSKKFGQGDFKVSSNTAKTLAFLWSMIAVAKGKLDDFAHIDKSNKIVSISLSKEKEEEKAPEQSDQPEPKKRGRKKSAPKTDAEKAEVLDAEQPTEQS